MVIFFGIRLSSVPLLSIVICLRRKSSTQMLWNIIFASLFRVAFAASISDAGRLSLSSATLNLCASAFNCETYQTSNGDTLIRFKQGMEPGTQSYLDAPITRQA